jgi:hypothetical protein
MKTFFQLLMLSSFVAMVMIAPSCGGGEKTDGNDSLKTDSVITDGPAPGVLPLDYPVIETTNAKAGEFVLAPSREFLNNAFEKGCDYATFIFYSFPMLTPGAKESKLSSFSDTVVMPNSLIIPIPANQTAIVGDIILTWWQSGSGMMRAIVVNADNPSEPVVKYLDLDWDNPATNSDGVSIGQMDEAIKPNTFVRINGDWEPGTAVAVNDNGSYKHAQIINVSGDKVLLCGFAGKLSVANKADCKPVPVYTIYNVGDEVWVPHIGSFTKGKIKKTDKKVGRYWVEIEFAGSKEEIVVAFSDAIKDL